MNARSAPVCTRMQVPGRSYLLDLPPLTHHLPPHHLLPSSQKEQTGRSGAGTVDVGVDVDERASVNVMIWKDSEMQAGLLCAAWHLAVSGSFPHYPKYMTDSLCAARSTLP